jgi:hypothetical protein
MCRNHNCWTLCVSIAIVGCSGQPTHSMPTSPAPRESPAQEIGSQSYYAAYWQCVGQPTSNDVQKRDAVNACLIERGYPPLP